MSLYSKEDTDRWDRRVISDRREYRKSKLLLPNSWTAFKEVWWRGTPERWAWLLEPASTPAPRLALTQLDTLKEIEDFVQEYKREPYIQHECRISKGKKGPRTREDQLGGWLDRIRRNNSKLLPSLREYQVKYLRSDWWRLPTQEEKDLDLLSGTDAYAVEHGREPLYETSEPYSSERMLYRWLQRIREGTLELYPSVEAYKVKGLKQSWWYYVSPEDKALMKLKKVDTFVRKNGREPRQDTEQGMYNFLDNLRTGNTEVYPLLKSHKTRGLREKWWEAA